MNSHDFKSETRNNSQAEPWEDLKLSTGEKSTLLGCTWNSVALGVNTTWFLFSVDMWHWLPKRFQEVSSKMVWEGLRGSWSRAMGDLQRAWLSTVGWCVIHNSPPRHLLATHARELPMSHVSDVCLCSHNSHVKVYGHALLVTFIDVVLIVASGICYHWEAKSFLHNMDCALRFTASISWVVQ